MPDPRLAIVTGSSRGIGRGLVEFFLARGWRVLGCSRGASEVRHELYEHHELDVADETAVCAFFDEVRDRYTRVDALINNAGIGLSSLALANPSAAVDRLLRTNLVGTMLMCREAARVMVAQRAGRIVNIASVAVPLRMQGSSVYSASKAAVVQYSKVLARELAPFNITCNVVAPSLVSMTGLLEDLKKEALTKYLDGLTIKRLATPLDVAHAVSFFVDEASGYVTGQVLYLGLAD